MADGAIEQGYGSKRGNIPEGRREVASLVVVVLRTHYDSELGNGGHPAQALGLRRWSCRQCVSLLADDKCFNAAHPFLAGGSVTTVEEGERGHLFRSGEWVIV